MRIDLKTALAIIIPIVGLLVPFIQWKIDQSPKSISINFPTKTSIQPQGKNYISGLELFSNGEKLETPYLTTIEISNNSSKHISKSDFETPIQFNINSATKIISVEISNKSPEDFEPKFIYDAKSITLEPTLFNSGDSLTLAALTSGERPDFQAKARILGVTNLKIAEGMSRKSNKINVVLMCLGTFIALSIQWLMIESMFKGSSIQLRPRPAQMIAIYAMVQASMGLTYITTEIEEKSIIAYVLIYIAIGIPAFTIAYYMNERKIPDTPRLD